MEYLVLSQKRGWRDRRMEGEKMIDTYNMDTERSQTMKHTYYIT
jgi:hypothetical protein